MFTLRKEDRVINDTAEIKIIPTSVIVSLSALGISTLAGFFTNSFIIVVHGIERLQGKNSNPKELILFTLGLFNIVFQCTMVANDSMLFLWSDMYFLPSVFTIFSIMLLFTIFSSFWFTFCLCAFYYVMLVTSEHTFLRCLKERISNVVPRMLFFSALLSLIISVPVAWYIKKDEYSIALDGSLTDNSTVQYGTPHMSLQYLLVTSIIGCCVPLILVAIVNILIIKCLYVHVKQIKKSAAMSVHSVEASVSAVRTVSSLLILYISFYVSETLLIMDIFKVDSPWITGCLVTVYSYAPVQSLILILGSPKLRAMIQGWLYPLNVTNNMFSGVKTDTSSSVYILTMSPSGHSFDQSSSLP